jgi:DNA-binding ferritin-like protein (Dps family)
MEEVIKNSKARFDHNQSKQILKEKYESKMLFAFNGGMWKADPILITTLSLFDDDDIVLEDVYGNPVKVIKDELLIKTKQHWQEQMNAWLFEFEQNSRER